jgi:hypothetical protein
MTFFFFLGQQVVFDGKLLRGAHVHLAEMVQTTKFFVIYGRGVVGSTPGCDVDFVQGTDPFRF